MLALRIVEHFYVVKHVVAGFCASLVGPAPDPLAFEQVEEAFGHGIVMAVCPPAHRMVEVVSFQE